VPQDSVLGLVLFTLYNSPIHVISVRCGVADHLFLLIFRCIQLSHWTRTTLNRSGPSPLSLPVLTRRSNGWRITLSSSMSQILARVVLSKSSRCKSAALSLIVGESSILPSDYVHYLGVILDKHLTMQQQIGNICRTSFYQLRRIAKITEISLTAGCCPTCFCFRALKHGLWQFSSGWSSSNATVSTTEGSERCSSCHYGRSSTRPNDVTLKRSPLAAYLIQDRLQDRDFDLPMFDGCAPSYLSSLLRRQST
jgi:hypothetical protein